MLTKLIWDYLDAIAHSIGRGIRLACAVVVVVWVLRWMGVAI